MNAFGPNVHYLLCHWPNSMIFKLFLRYELVPWS